MHSEKLLSAIAESPDAVLVELSRLDCEDSLAEFTRQAWHVVEPGTPLIWNWHLDVLCAYIEAFLDGRIPRLIVNVSPGCMKSLLFSVMGPAWKWAKDPSARFINLTNESGLATRDNRRMRNIIQSDWYQARWGDKVVISKDQDEKTLFENTQFGFRQGLGLTGNISGKRGNFLLMDDPLDAKKAFSDVECKTVNDTYDQAVSSRLNDLTKDGIGLIMQRLRQDDLTGHLEKKKKQKWVSVRIPMEYEGEPSYDPVKDLGPEYAHLRDPRTKIGELMFPQRFPREAVEALKEDLGEYGTAGQLQQRPSPLGGGIIKKNWWRQWPAGKPLPLCKQVFASYDTAYTEKDYKEAAYTARTTWGIFEDEETGRDAIMLLEAWFERVGYPALRKIAKDHNRNFNLDVNVVERKASGYSLIQDMRRIKLACRGFDPKPYGDKISRAHFASPFFESGLVFYPDREWARKVIDLVSTFPTGAPPSADVTDTVTQAVIYVRKRMWTHPPDEDDEPKPEHNQTEEEIDDTPERKRAAYG